MCSQRTPERMNSSRMWIECPTLTANATVLRRSPYLCQCVTMSPTSLARSMRSASCGLDIVAVARAHAAEIGIDRRVGARRHQEAEPDQVRHLRTLDHRLEDAAEPAPVAAAWRGREAEQHRVGIGRDDLPVGLRRGVVALIDRPAESAGGRSILPVC